MKAPYLLIVLVLFGMAGCRDKATSTEQKLSHFKKGDLASSLEAAMSLSKHPSYITPNFPLDEEYMIYFLPDGDVHVSTKQMDDRRVVLSSSPFFRPDKTPVEQRVANSNRAWDEYVRKKTGK
jgi:hypothetical protein